MPVAFPLISIITPVYDSQEFITSCIEKIQQQTYKNFEHLVIDGGSKDNTVELIKQYSSKYENIKWISEKDSGIYDAMNKGIKLAKGKWLLFLGSDDYFYENDVLEKISSSLQENNGSRIIYGNVWFERKKCIYDGMFTIDKILKHNICHQGIFYRKDLFEDMSGYNLKYKQHADYDYNLRCWLSGRIKHQFFPITIAVFSDGGDSSFEADVAMVADYPDIIIDTIIAGSWNGFQKITILSKAFRKIIMRYPISIFYRQLLKKDGHFISKVLSLFWIPVDLVVSRF